MSDELTPNKVERPDCGHMEVILARPMQSLADYHHRLVPELREAIQSPCEQCEKAKADLAKQKLVQEMQEKAKSK